MNRHLDYSKKLFVGEGAKKRIGRIKWRLKHGAGLLRTYCVLLPEYGKDLLELYNSSVLKQKYYKEKRLRIVGLAEGYEEALNVIAEILELVLKETGGFDIRSYFDRCQNELKSTEIHVCPEKDLWKEPEDSIDLEGGA